MLSSMSGVIVYVVQYSDMILAWVGGGGRSMNGVSYMHIDRI